MKEIMSKVTKNVKDISGSVVGQTQTTLAQGKVELALVQAKNNIQKLYTQLGKKLYQNRLYPQTDPGIEPLYKLISKREQEIVELRKKAEIVRREQKDTFESVKRKVQNTWDEVEKEPKTPEKGEDGYIQMKFCDECSIGNHPEAAYCIACGNSFEPAAKE